ncbi:transglycosylase domain-containing protein [Capillibacterium thermochitinicola]|uniref:PBP1A family penicillin-binding protein n=1 Tax=Capillibacterium thermochitinicola TaxID=2699427 RepID=A0A8J6I0Q8_9FIRM|nr:PBP1A family penicillin-binding protein [Capillibacterium thermochitinicola]MBA2133500.1 PBP1A family penicillin-binding protein [Capillibacterium thermochitinicola]
MAKLLHKPFGLSWRLIGIVVVSGLFLGIAAGIIFGSKIPDNPPPPVEATIIYDINGDIVQRLFQENRIPVDFDQIPEMMKNAIIAVEDPDFYNHRGIKIRAILRAVWVNLLAWDFKQGGSTITQQYAKVSLLTHKKTISRKVKEWFYAINLERNLSKNEILERYLNYIYFGNGAHGVEAAAQRYFNKHIWELELPQFALLAGIIRSPGYYCPFKNPENALERRNFVLEKMVEAKFITPEEAAQARQTPLGVVSEGARIRNAPYFVDYIIQELTVKHNMFTEEDLYTQGYRIYTTLDLRMQAIAEEAIADLPTGKPDRNNVTQPQIAFVAMDPTNGHIKAMIGGRDWQNTQLNRATKAYRQPGSCIKPFVYAAAIDSHRFTPATVLIDEEIEYPSGDGGSWIPQNFSKTFQGPVRLRTALENSLNTISVRLTDQLGVSTIFKMAQNMGLTSLVSSGGLNDMALSPLALGGLTRGVTPLELTAAYTPFANKGIYSEPLAILKVTDSQGRVLLENGPKRRVVIRESVAYVVTDMLKGVIENGTGRRGRIGRPAAGKTGTSDQDTNAWFVGYTPEIIAGVWIGNDSQAVPLVVNNTKITSGYAAEIWGRFARRVLENRPITDFPVPAGVSTNIEVCAETGYLASPYCPETIREVFIAGTEPVDSCPTHSAPDLGSKIILQVCLDSGALATTFCPADRVITKTYWAVTGTETTDGSPMPTGNCPLHGETSSEEVVLEVCTESGLIATPFCPFDAVETMSFTPGDEPTLPCNLHAGRNRR